MIEGLKGFGEGIENGSLAFFNALTGGAYDVFSYSYMNNDYAKRQEKAAACNFLSIKTHIKLFYCDLPIFRRFYRLSVYLMCKAP